jgi:hypothetical protein
LQIRLYLVGVVVLMLGLGSALFIYQTAGDDSTNILGYEEEGGTRHPIMPEDSKQYLRNMELYGGKMNVMADEFNRWFIGLWQGKSLAFTIGCLTILVSFGIFYAADHLRL